MGGNDTSEEMTENSYVVFTLRESWMVKFWDLPISLGFHGRKSGLPVGRVFLTREEECCCSWGQIRGLLTE